MLANFKKSITITGQSIIEVKNGEDITRVVAENYNATIDNNGLEIPNIYASQVDKTVYKANREQCRKDRADFEDMVYAIQDELITDLEAETEAK